jgi:hypothetical protein
MALTLSLENGAGGFATKCCENGCRSGRVVVRAVPNGVPGLWIEGAECPAAEVVEMGPQDDVCSTQRRIAPLDEPYDVLRLQS